jgi:hypothetical protein
MLKKAGMQGDLPAAADAVLALRDALLAPAVVAPPPLRCAFDQERDRLGSGQFGHVFRCRLDGEAGQLHAVKRVDRIKAELGRYPIVTPQYSATTLYQEVSCRIQSLCF